MFEKMLNKHKKGTMPKEYAESAEAEMMELLKSDQAASGITLADFLRLYVNRLPAFGAKETKAWDVDPNSIAYKEVDIYFTFPDDKPCLSYPLVFYQPELKQIISDDFHYTFKNLDRFLADYHEARNAWIGASDIMGAKVTNFHSTAWKYRCNLIIQCELQ